jgi:hypothetical protein
MVRSPQSLEYEEYLFKHPGKIFSTGAELLACPSIGGCVPLGGIAP